MSYFPMLGEAGYDDRVMNGNVPGQFFTLSVMIS